MNSSPDAQRPTTIVPRLVLTDISKRYPGVVANDRVSLSLRAGEIHAVLGENGAGKSTLMRIIAGATTADAGDIRIDGRKVSIRSPRDARMLGIAMVHQHFSLFDSLTVAENVALGIDARVPFAELSRRILAIAADYGLEIDTARPVNALSVGERQRVEIIRALLQSPRVLILDEPTSVLAPKGVAGLFAVLRRLADEGCGILYISHKLDEIRALCHHCTVLRGGRVVGEVDPSRETTASLSRLMVGAEAPRPKLARTPSGAVRLAVERLSLPARERHGRALRECSFELCDGEILGVAGVSGNGQNELLDALVGEDRRAPAGAIRLGGLPIGTADVRARRAAGMRFVPEERLGRATVPSMTLADNMLLTRTAREPGRASGWRPRELRDRARRVIERFEVKASGPEAPARSLSGGNLQKFVVGREVEAAPRVLIVAQPTWGVDVGAAARIRGELIALRNAGCAVLVVSEDLDELFEISDRLIVIADGSLSPALQVAQAEIDRIGEWMSGLWPGGPASERAGDAARA